MQSFREAGIVKYGKGKTTMNSSNYISKQKENIKRYGLLFCVYAGLILARLALGPYLAQVFEKPNPLYYLAGGWILWYIGPLIVSANPLYFKANILALIIYHVLFFVCYAYGTSWLKKYWLPAILLPIITWLSGYLLLHVFASRDIINGILHGASGW